MRKLLISFAFAFVAAAGAAAIAGAPAADPIVGTWRLNVAKSTFGASPAPKSQMRTYSQAGPSITLVMKEVDADGKEMTTRTTYQLDGKDYAVIGSPNYDSLSARQVDSNTATFTLKKAGKTVATSSRTVAKDGKSMTSKMRLTTAQGEASESELVFDKQ